MPSLRRALFIGLVAAACHPAWAAGPEADVDRLLDRFHLAASQAKFDDYFGLLAPDAVFIGTDATERWTVEQFKAYAKPHFDKGKGWTYTKVERHILVSADDRHASFDELLDNASLGRCRGTGVLRRVDGQWKIEQYHLTIPVPNELALEVVKMIRR
ncbi:nuclear transport factor 2 family protein [Piscinibacter terrae]|uniref:Protein with SnoaL 3 domain, NTF 2 superfamily n=1 Tax=Piscinibacter terrae TaxID=2496871 RepID=A0A3N7HW00_9BURK|nr:nuclear transport factor 2 family protein [Albitalea terrae]RQP25566.1 protein with SnoaL 3 domain, NTF 2 superfamily [Albitalea terrae]